MRYYKTSQPIPGKGDALIFYECNEDQSIRRYVTFIPMTGETERVGDPIVKKLYRAETLLMSNEAEFQQHWSQAGA